MDLTPHLTAAQLVAGLLASAATGCALLLAAVRFVVTPRIRALVTDVVEQEFEKREAANAASVEAERSAIEDLGERIHRIEERMSENEKATAQTQAAVARIEEATKRQSVTLDAIAEGVIHTRESVARIDERLKSTDKAVDDLKQGARRRSR